jgi:HK97 family phage major capsid protein
MGAMIWDREQASIRVSEHHDDYFTRNMVAVLCEERLAFTIFRPESFVAVTFDEAPVEAPVNGGA